MAGIIILNRRLVFGVTFLLVFIVGGALHTLITGNNEITNTLEIIVLLGSSLGCAYAAARRFPPSNGIRL